VKQSLAWLWLIGAVLYAVSVWLSADAVNIAGHKGQKSASSSPAIATPILGPPITESQKTEQLVEARTEPIALQSSLDPALSSPGTASEPAQKAEAASEASTAAPAERFVVRSAANIRNGPSSKSTPIGTAPAGAELEVAEREGGWVRFVDPATSHTGWIYEGLLTGIGAQSVTPGVEQTNAASVSTAAGPKAKVQARNATGPVNTAARPKAKVQARNATRPASGGVSKQGAGGRPFGLGYAKTPSAEELGPYTRRFGFFARRRMVREGLLGPD
jgi:Bacterial SH3 domain